MITKTVTYLILLASLNAFSTEEGALKAIYGKDDRVEPYTTKNMIVRNSINSIAAMVSIPRLNNGNLTGSPYSNKVCKSVRFSEQTMIAKCTGFLVSDRHIITAGHCMKTQDYCSKFKWVFGFFKKNKAQNQFKIPSTDIYNCKKIIEQKFSGFGAIDHAVIELDRPVTKRVALKFRESGTIHQEDKLILMGFPTGLPLKVVLAGKILKNDHDTFFETDLDSFGGNSGSPVINARTGLVEGIQTRGNAGYVRSSNSSCKVLKVCKPGDCHTAKAGRISNIKFLKDLI